MRTLFFLLLLTLCPLWGYEISLKNELVKAKEQSWVVTEQNKNYIFFYIRQTNANTIWVEEVMVPCAKAPKKEGWQSWFERGAPGHTLWTLSEIDVSEGRFIKSYSYTHKEWLSLDNSAPFMATLLNLRFSEVPLQNRKRVGLPPPRRKADNRPLWQPRMTVEGKKRGNISFGAWHTRWPSDGSELSRKRIEIYLPEMQGDYPSYFPYWLEVEGKIGSHRLRIVDSGLHASSPQQTEQ